MVDRPVLLGNFKNLVYSETIEDLETRYDLVVAEFAQKYPGFISYVASVYEEKEAWALPYKENMLTRGSHTNNSAESQFLCV